MDAVRQKLKMHRSFVGRFSKEIVGVDDTEDLKVAGGAGSPVHHMGQREKPFVFIGGAVEENAGGDGITLKPGNCFREVVLIDKMCCEPAGSGCRINALEELAIEFPIPCNSNIKFLAGCFHQT